MKIAIIDLGTNSVRFVIYHISSKFKTRLIFHKKTMVRLGEGVFLKKQLNGEAIDRTVKAFVKFKKRMDEFKVKSVVAIATSAMREAKDGKKLVGRICRITGINLKIISGFEEARLIALGIMHNESRLPKEAFGLIDIGGGSTEVSIVCDKRVVAMESFPLGTARLQQMFLRGHPPTSQQINKLRSHIRKVMRKEIKDWPSIAVAYASSGTARAIAKIIKKKQKRVVSCTDIKKLVSKMKRRSTLELMDIPGMERKRVDMILGGTILLEECLCELGAKKMIPTIYSLRDGLLAEQIQILKKN